MHLRRLLILSFLFISFSAFSQQDFLQLKRGDRTIRNYFKGSYITVQIENRQWITGRIYKLVNDSVYLYQIDVQMRPNAYGLGAVADTSVFGLLPFSLKNIYAIPNEHRGLTPLVGNIFQIGAAGYVGLNLINAANNKEPVFDDTNKKRLGGAAVAFLLGTLIKSSSPATFKLGKKYKLVYQKVTQ